MQAGANYIVDKLTLSKLVKAGIAFGSVQAISSVPTADAGFGLFALCMSSCLAASSKAFTPMYWQYVAGLFLLQLHRISTLRPAFYE